MTLQQAIAILEAHQIWRRGADTPMVDMYDLGIAIDVLLKNVKEKILCECEPHSYYEWEKLENKCDKCKKNII